MKGSHGWAAMVQALRSTAQGIHHGSTAVSLSPHGASHGFTMVEVMVGVMVSGLLVVGVTRFFTDSHRNYNLREKLSERDQNGQYVVKHLEDRLMEAGANLPDTGMILIEPGKAPEDGFNLAINPRGGVQPIYSDLPSGNRVPLDDQTGFREASSVLLVPIDKAKAPEILTIETSFSQGGFVKGLKDGSQAQDTLRLASARAFKTGDMLYAFASQDYVLKDGMFTMKGVVLAENLDALELTFQDAAGNPTKDWYAMRSAKLAVTVRTSEPDLANTPDIYRRVTLTSEVRLRNRP